MLKPITTAALLVLALVGASTTTLIAKDKPGKKEKAAEPKPMLETIEEDALSFMTILGEGPFDVHQKGTDKYFNRAEAHKLHEAPIFLYRTDPRGNRSLFWLENYTNKSKKKNRPSFDVVPLRRIPGKGYVKGSAIQWKKASLSSSKLKFDGRAWLQGFDYQKRLSDKVEYLRTFGAFLYYNDCKWAGNAVLTFMMKRFPKTKVDTYAFIRSKHEWADAGDMGYARIGPNWELTIPGKLGGGVITGGDHLDKAKADWEAWCVSEFKRFAEDYEKTVAYTKSVSWASMSSAKIDKRADDVYSWSELSSRFAELKVNTSQSKAQRAAQVEAAGVPIEKEEKEDPKDKKKRRSKKKKKRSSKKLPTNAFLIDRELQKTIDEMIDAVAAARKHSADAKSARDKNLGNEEVRRHNLSALAKISEVFPVPGEKRRKEPAIAAVDATVFDDVAQLFKELSGPDQYNLAVNNSSMAKNAITAWGMYLAHFPMNSWARFYRGKVYMSLRKFNESRIDFRSIRDDKFSNPSTKDKAKIYLGKLDKAETAKGRAKK